MDRKIANAILRDELKKLRQFSYEEIKKLMGKPSTTIYRGPDGKTYQVEIQAFWDSKVGGDIRVMVAADDGGLSAFLPLSESFIISLGGLISTQ